MSYMTQLLVEHYNLCLYCFGQKLNSVAMITNSCSNIKPLKPFLSCLRLTWLSYSETYMTVTSLSVCLCYHCNYLILSNYKNSNTQLVGYNHNNYKLAVLVTEFFTKQLLMRCSSYTNCISISYVPVLWSIHHANIQQPAGKKFSFSMEETLWRLVSHKDTGGTDLPFLYIFYKTLQHGHPHNVVLTMEPSLHHYSDYHHCQVCHTETRRLTV